MRSLNSGMTCREFGFVFLPAFLFCMIAKLEPADHRRQHQALPDKRQDDHTERDEQNEIAMRKVGAARRGEGNRQSCGKRYDAAHVDEAENEWRLPCR